MQFLIHAMLFSIFHLWYFVGYYNRNI